MHLKGFLLPALMAGLVASSVAACGQFKLMGGFDSASNNGTGGGTSAAATSAASSSSGFGGSGDGGYGQGGSIQDSDFVPPINDSYDFLCGPRDPCTPGSSSIAASCAPGGDPGQGGGAGVSFNCVLESRANMKIADVCVPSGPSNLGEACVIASDCATGLGCVKPTGYAQNGTGGVCRPYCCDKVSDCEKGTWCAPARMTDVADPAPLIPVCIPATNCTPLDDVTCTDGLKCTIVRDDGTTSCVKPGTGKRGAKCPCAEGYFCSSFDGKCLQLCHVGTDGECEPGGTCAGGIAGYPDGIGICEGY